jgi:hypothetical protein
LKDIHFTVKIDTVTTHWAKYYCNYVVGAYMIEEKQEQNYFQLLVLTLLMSERRREKDTFPCSGLVVMKAILISALNWTQVSSTESHIVV